MSRVTEQPKAPRWISTEAGLWAWQAYDNWRNTAANALSVQDRQRLLHEAKQLRQGASQQAH